jgi:tRNA(Ile)-lysidine synthase
MKEAYDFIVNECNIKYNDVVVAAISGGPDSMALLNLLINIKKELNIFIVCAHVNHNVRKESDNEEKFLHEYCNNNGVCFEAMKIKKYSDDNFHNEARSIRYEFFEEIMKKYNSSYLFTAHHGDDLIETILMRIVRGSTLKGYSGFSKKSKHKNYNLIRPLMFYTKDYLLEYDKLNNIPYVIDSSNEKDVYTRNRYRKKVLPFLKSEDKNVHLKFIKYSNVLIKYNNYIDKEIEKALKKLHYIDSINIQEFIKLDDLIQTGIIYKILENMYNDDLMFITDSHVELILNLFNSKKANSIIHLPNNVCVKKSYDEIKFVVDDNVNDVYEIELIKVANLPNGKNIEMIDKCDWTNNYCTRLNSKSVKLPLYVRTRRDGDKINVKNMLGRKKVNDIFIEHKISMDDRDSWPIVCDAEDKIIWIPGLKKSKFDKEINEEYDIILRYY